MLGPYSYYRQAQRSAAYGLIAYGSLVALALWRMAKNSDHERPKGAGHRPCAICYLEVALW